ncbi:hypothetical protein CEXT_258141 [Caerostris extrusa]|uniref:Uncharacterized protein n=1 Tax=Caerostris extrusa TaxID=172846 RepID=A0AAV4P4Z8_CAEEX|nr:hypothetical protein CEXT_258141 [Caerostris extrusa]
MVHSRDPFLTPYDVTSLRCPPVRWEQRVGEVTSRPSIGKGLRKRIYSAVSINARCAGALRWRFQNVNNSQEGMWTNASFEFTKMEPSHQ